MPSEEAGPPHTFVSLHTCVSTYVCHACVCAGALGFYFIFFVSPLFKNIYKYLLTSKLTGNFK